MRNFYLTFFAIFTLGFLQAQIIDIPDDNFKYLLVYGENVRTVASGSYLVSADSNGDFEIQQSEAEAVIYMRLESFGNEIYSMEGIQHFSNLETLKLADNYLTTLDVSMLSELRILECQDNNLTSLNVAGLANLVSLNFEDEDHQRDNQVSNIDLTGLVSLNSLKCNRNGLANLDFTGINSLTFLECAFNNLTTLDLSNQVNFNLLNCSGNDLFDLNLKNGSIESIVIIGSNNSNLNYICADNEDIDELQESLDAIGNDNCVLNSYCSFEPGGEFYTVNGDVRVDIEDNGCDTNDYGYQYLKFEVENSNQDLVSVVYSNENGAYELSNPEGSYIITPQPEYPEYFEISPENIVVDFPVDSSPLLQDFCMTPIGEKNDLEITLLPLNDAIPGFDSNYKIIYKNNGNTIISGEVELSYFYNQMNYVSATPSIDSQSLNELRWNYIDLVPFETREIYFTMNINEPTELEYPVNSGDLLVFDAFVRPIVGDETINDNYILIPQTVVNSFDPNDKTCLEGDFIREASVGEYVHYMIRFENTGTANAINVVVKDEIDTSKYDVSTIIPLDASHDFVTRIQNTNEVEFIFENIDLPFDDANNDGYVVFKIKTLETLSVGDTFSNDAEIYFDFNFPIITNDYITTVEENLSVEELELKSKVNIYPNPVSDLLHITYEKNIDSISIYDVNGRLLQTIAFLGNSTEQKIDFKDFSSGVYFIKMKSTGASVVEKVIKD